MKVNGSSFDVADDGSTIGFTLAHPPPGEEIVVSGLAGKFPLSDDAAQFRDNLFNKVVLITADERRLTSFQDDLPERSGRVYTINNLDAGCFGLHSAQASAMDPMTRLLIEKAVEAVIDAGINPGDLAGTRTAVYVGISWSDTEKEILFEHLKGETVLGCSLSQAAQRISYHLKLNGPSFTCDTACSSSGYALELAYRNLRMGKCDNAIVGGANLCLFGNMSMQFARLGMLSPDGVPRVFDDDANGYVRADAISAILLQRAKDAKRIYCKVIHAKVNSDGYKSEGITYPSKISQSQFLGEFYEECAICPSDVDFVEAHGTGTKVGDPEEVSAIASVFCKNRPKPLLIGSVKSNMGHSEPASGIASIAKIVFAMETGYIAPNINFKRPKRDIPALHDGRVSVVTEKTPWGDGRQLAGLNNFGFGGSNFHVLMAPNEKLKVNGGLPADDLPRLICASGRTPEAINSIFDFVKDGRLDADYVRLLHDVFRDDMPNELFRGFSIVSKNGELKRSTKARSKTHANVCLMFDGFGNERWSKVRSGLLDIPVFGDALRRIQCEMDRLKKGRVLEPERNGNSAEDLLGAVAIQIGLSEIIKKIGLEPDYFMGDDGLGELVCAYCDGLLSLEQVLTATYHVGSSEFGLRKYGKDDFADFASLTKSSDELSKLIGFREFKATRWIRNRNPSKLTLLDVLLGPFRGCDAPKATSNLVVHFDASSRIPPPDKALCLIDDVNASDSVLTSLLTNLGRLYESGVNFNPAHLYPEVQWPVCKGTPMISPSIKWKYDRPWFVTQCKQKRFSTNTEIYTINTKFNDWAYLKGHVIDGSVLFPAAGYLYLVWVFLSERVYMSPDTFNVVFHDVKFLKASNISRRSQISYRITIESNGDFELVEDDVVLVTGNVQQLEETEETFTSVEDLDVQEGDGGIPLLKNDIYKELKLRGYNYMDEFRGIISCNNLATVGTLKWEDNWVTLIDSMLQINILQTDTRNLFIPTGIGKLIINAKKHRTYVTDEGTMDVYCKREANITTCGAVEITGLSVSQISRRKTLADAVLESYEFVPNEGALPLEQCVRVNIQIILENIQEITFKTVEVLHGKSKNKDPLCQIIQRVLSDQPLIQPDIKLLTNEPPELPGITVETTPLSNMSNCLLVVAIDLLTDNDMMAQALNAIDENGYVMARQEKSFRLRKKPDDLELITSFETERETVLLLKKYKYRVPKILNLADPVLDLSWLPRLQQLRKKNDDIVVVSQGIEYSGALGFINCLRREAAGSKIRCAVLSDDLPTFNLEEEFYGEQMRKGMAINVWRDGKWGTYRHLLLRSSEETTAEAAFVSVISPGDLSSLKWTEGPLTLNSIIEEDEMLVHVYYSALNFRDVLTASGRMPIDYGVTTRVRREGTQGLEFAGRDTSGKRVFGLAVKGGLSTLYVAESILSWDVPDEWTMAEAVTVPVVYATVLYSLVVVANVRRGQSILIHSGTGGVGQAAINVALYYGCTIFITVGTEEKKAFILKHFPQINAAHIGNSRDTSFEQMISAGTNGRGVDIVLNSLTQEKLHATVRCVAKGGCYLEIGKVDLLSNNELSTQMFERGIKATGVMLDTAWLIPEEKKKISELITKHVKNGAVKPLYKTVYSAENIEAAYRFMGAGKHVGKVVIEIRQEERNSDRRGQSKELFKCKPIFYCDPDSSYVIIGGLGGVGLELADWLIVKGCKKLILVSRHGLKTGYQALRIRFWEKYASVIHVSTEDTTTRNGCVNLLKKANDFGPVDGIFNLAVDLKDALFENQSVETFVASFKPKAIATRHLDEISRRLCPQLRYFVVFSSVSAGRGNQGQTNYGTSNSIMENICERRRRDGLPALVVQWGAIGDVGLVADMNELNRDVVIGGTLPQRISSCLDVLDRFLRQEKVVVSSMVVAEKTVGGNTEEIICNILGIKNVETVNQQLTFPDLGMDSITGLEIKQVIERQFDIMLTAQELKSMTFLRLKELSQNKNVPNVPAAEYDWLGFLLRYMNQVNLSNTPSVQINARDGNDQRLPEVSFLPGIDGMSVALQPLISKLKCRANICQYLFTYANDDIQSIAKEILKYVKHNESTFTLVAYSFGCLVALEVVALLEAQGCVGKVVFIDGTAQQLRAMARMAFPMKNEDAVKMSLLLKILQSASLVFTKEFEAELALRKTMDEKIDYVMEKSPNKTFSKQYLRDTFYVIFKRIRAMHDYERSFKKLKSRAKLLRPTVAFFPVDDATFSDLFENPVEIKKFDGDHESILTSNDLANEIDDFIRAH